MFNVNQFTATATNALTNILKYNYRNRTSPLGTNNLSANEGTVVTATAAQTLLDGQDTTASATLSGSAIDIASQLKYYTAPRSQYLAYHAFKIDCEYSRFENWQNLNYHEAYEFAESWITQSTTSDPYKARQINNLRVFNIVVRSFPNWPVAHQSAAAQALCTWRADATGRAGLTGVYTGYVQPYSPNYCNGTNEPFFAHEDIQVRQLINGQPAKTAGRYILSLSVPLMSTIFGVLLPQDLYKYIPLAPFDELTFSFRLNPYAFYTSGYFYDNPQAVLHGNTQFFRGGINSQTTLVYAQGSRDYNIIKAQLVVDLLSFGTEIERVIAAQWDSPEGIILQTAMFALGPMQTFANTASVQTTVQLNMGFNSLKSAFWVFLPLDF